MKYDVIIIGSGPGGYVCAIRAAQLGLKVAIIEKYDALGGTCLNVGCIPSKAILNFSEFYFQLKHRSKDFGILLENDPKMDIDKMMKKKNKIVSELNQGIQYLMKKNKINVYHGMGQFIDTKKIKVIAKDQTEKILETNYTVIATGSKPFIPKNMLIDKKRILSSTEILSLNEIPKKIILVGGGIIAVEMGSVFARLGSEVILLEATPFITPVMDKDISLELEKILSKDLNITIHKNYFVQKVENKGSYVRVEASEEKSGSKIFEADYAFIMIGRIPYTTNLGLENIGITLNEKGQIPVSTNLETKIPGIFAIGDVIQGAMLAHKASEEGVFVAEKMVGQKPHIKYHLIPSVIYTYPEVASVGYSEKELKEKNISYNIGTFSFKGIGRAKATLETEGFVKVIVDQKTDEILSVSIIGPRAGDMIATAVTAMEYRASSEDITRISFAHPTFAEAFKEACLDATGKRAIHM